jgi:hypothetical protein
VKFSEDRISHFAHIIHKGLTRDQLVVYTDEDKAHREIKKTLIEYLKVEDAADQAAREKVASLKRGVLEGSREWEILYRKYFEEEMGKKGR